MGYRRSPKSLVIKRDMSCYDGEALGIREEVSSRRAASLVGQCGGEECSHQRLNCLRRPVSVKSFVSTVRHLTTDCTRTKVPSSSCPHPITQLPTHTNCKMIHGGILIRQIHRRPPDTASARHRFPWKLLVIGLTLLSIRSNRRRSHDQFLSRSWSASTRRRNRSAGRILIHRR